MICKNLESSLSAIAMLIFVIAAIKMCGVVFANPVIGFGNNYDFVRQSACVGLWQPYSEGHKAVARPERPINPLIYDGETSEDYCIRSTDNIFPYLATIFHDKGEYIDIREVSFWKVVATLLFGGVVAFRMGSVKSRFAICLAFFLIFGDWAVLSYANTLYLEFSVIASCFFVISVFVNIMSISAPLRIEGVIIAIVSVVWLGLSKQQYIYLASIFAIYFGISLWSRSDVWQACIIIVVGIMLPSIFSAINKPGTGHMVPQNFANKTDTFLQAVLPEAEDKPTALQILGLPASCISAIGKSWYDADVQIKHPCPEVAHVSRANLIPLFLADPQTFFYPMRNATERTWPLYPYYLGDCESPAQTKSLGYKALKVTSLSSFILLVPQGLFSKFLYLSMAGGICAHMFLAYYFIVRKGARNSELWLSATSMVGVGGGVVIYAISSSVFGDGYSEVPKHAVGLEVGVVFQVIGLFMLVFDVVAPSIRLHLQSLADDCVSGAIKRKL